jgi:hypothetical protein
MKFIDLTDKLSFKYDNYYIFNNSILHFKDNIFLMSYRTIKYNLGVKIHPWSFWINRYKLLQNREIEKNKHFEDIYKLYDTNKYRYGLGLNHDNIIILDNNLSISHISEVLEEFDGTGLAILEYNEDLDDFTVKYNMNNIFGNEMNQDARLQYSNGEIWITYNVFLSNDQGLRVELFKRKLYIDLDAKFIYMTPESYLLHNKHNLVEKNCTIHNDNVLYEIHHNFVVHRDNGDIFLGNNDIIKKFKKNNKNVIFSLGTPAIRFGSDFLCAGHLKLEYKKEIGNNNCFSSSFLNSIDWTKIKKHGKYIYFAFFILFDSNYNILKMTDFFIPSNDNDHLPYLLSFPTGLTMYKDNIFMSYGEGDERTKILRFNTDEIFKLLKTDNFGYTFLDLENLSNSQKVILHTGYFNEWNCGDDAFVYVFKFLNKLYPKYKISFSANQKYDLKVLGGGDVINNYFIDERMATAETDTVKKSCIGFGIGIPYISLVDNLKCFKCCYLRNKLDYEKYKDVYNIKFIPDITWLLPRIIRLDKVINCDKILGSNKMKIGISLPRQYFHDKYTHLYIDLVKELSIFINKMDSNKYEIHLIPFDINKNKIKENDLILNMHLSKLCPNVVNHVVEQNYKYVDVIYNLVNTMDFMVVGRFHAHVFSTILKKPFVSLSCSRKTSELMKEYEFEDNLYRFDTNDILLPINFKGDKFYDWLIIRLNDIDNIRNKVAVVSDKYLALSETIIEEWKDIVDNL